VTIDLESEHKYYHHLLELARGSRGEAVLTPIEEGQKKAVIRVFVNKDGEHILLSAITVNLTDFNNPLPNITVSGFISGTQLILSVSVEGVDFPVKPIRVGTFLRKSWKPPLLIMAAVLIMALLLFVFFKVFPLLKSEPQVLPSSEPQTREPQTSTVEIQTEAEKVTATTSDAPEAGNTISTSTTIYFYPNSSKLKDGEKQKLDNTAEFLIRHPEKKVVIEGHCALYGTQEGRVQVSRARAEKIRDYLIQKGWKSNEPPLITWYGASKPVTTDPAQKDKNRRVEIRISNQL